MVFRPQKEHFCARHVRSRRDASFDSLERAEKLQRQVGPDFIIGLGAPFGGHGPWALARARPITSLHAAKVRLVLEFSISFGAGVEDRFRSSLVNADLLRAAHGTRTLALFRTETFAFLMCRSTHRNNALAHGEALGATLLRDQREGALSTFASVFEMSTEGVDLCP